MLDHDNINIIAALGKASSPAMADKISITIEIEAFGRGCDEVNLNKLPILHFLGVDLKDRDWLEHVEFDGRKYWIPLDEIDTFVTEDKLPWEFRVRRGANGNGRWVTRIEFILVPLEEDVSFDVTVEGEEQRFQDDGNPLAQ